MISRHHYIPPLFCCFSFIHYRISSFSSFSFVWLVLKDEPSWKCPKGSERTKLSSQTKLRKKLQGKGEALHSNTVLFGHVPVRKQTTHTYTSFYLAALHCHWHGTYCFWTLQMKQDMSVMTWVIGVFPRLALNFHFLPLHSTNEYLRTI